MTTYQEDKGEGSGGDGCVPVIGFDMGGTSTDVSRYDGEYEHVFESTIAGVTIQAPQVYFFSLETPPTRKIGRGFETILS